METQLQDYGLHFPLLVWADRLTGGSSAGSSAAGTATAAWSGVSFGTQPNQKSPRSGYWGFWGNRNPSSEIPKGVWAGKWSPLLMSEVGWPATLLCNLLYRSTFILRSVKCILGLFMFPHPPNSDMDYRILNMRTWSFLCLHIYMGHCL